MIPLYMNFQIICVNTAVCMLLSKITTYCVLSSVLSFEIILPHDPSPKEYSLLNFFHYCSHKVYMLHALSFVCV